MSLTSPEPEKPPYNTDPQDQPADGADPAAKVAWGKAMNRYWIENPEPPFTWAEIQASAAHEYTARLRQFAFQKNYKMVDWMLDNPLENLPDDLLVKAQGHTRNDWEVL